MCFSFFYKGFGNFLQTFYYISSLANKSNSELQFIVIGLSDGGKACLNFQ